MDNKEELNVSTKNRFTALMLCWFLGFLAFIVYMQEN